MLPLDRLARAQPHSEEVIQGRTIDRPGANRPARRIQVAGPGAPESDLSPAFEFRFNSPEGYRVGLRGSSQGIENRAEFLRPRAGAKEPFGHEGNRLEDRPAPSQGVLASGSRRGIADRDQRRPARPERTQAKFPLHRLPVGAAEAPGIDGWRTLQAPLEKLVERLGGASSAGLPRGRKEGEGPAAQVLSRMSQKGAERVVAADDDAGIEDGQAIGGPEKGLVGDLSPDQIAVGGPGGDRVVGRPGGDRHFRAWRTPRREDRDCGAVRPGVDGSPRDRAVP